MQHAQNQPAQRGSRLKSSDHEVQHVGFQVEGGSTHDELTLAIAEARDMGLPIGFGERSIHHVLMDRPARENKRGMKKSYKTEVSKSRRGRK